MRGESRGALVRAAITLALDAAAGQVVAAWREQGIDSIVLKGPAVADWLYPGLVRAYGDIDLLVDPRRVFDAADVLRRLGFAPHDESLAVHSHPWVRNVDNAIIDLHVNVWGALRPAPEVWEELRREVVPQPLGAVEAQALGLPGRALHVVLHAAQHAEQDPPRQDLRRALAAGSREVWDGAVALADRVWALEAMAAGLELVPEGRSVLGRHRLLRAAAMRGRGEAPFAIGLARVLEAPGPAGKLKLLVWLLAEAERDPRRNDHPAPRRGLRRPLAYARWTAALVPDMIRTVRAAGRKGPR